MTVLGLKRARKAKGGGTTLKEGSPLTGPEEWTESRQETQSGYFLFLSCLSLLLKRLTVNDEPMITRGGVRFRRIERRRRNESGGVGKGVEISLKGNCSLKKKKARLPFRLNQDRGRGCRPRVKGRRLYCVTKESHPTNGKREGNLESETLSNGILTLAQ